MTELNIIGGIKNRTIKDSMTLADLVGYIRNPDVSHQEKVELARVCGKGTPQYETIKESSIPCVVLNFLHSKGYVNGSTATKPTGFLYLDVDNTLDVPLNSPHIAAYWKSLSGRGYSIVVAARGLTKNNIKTATREVAEILDIPLDTAAISIDRLTCISYDPDAYYNPNAISYDIQCGKNADTKSTQTMSTDNNSLLRVIDCVGNFSGSEIRVSNLDEVVSSIDFDANPVHDFGEAGVMYADIRYSIYGVSEGKRNHVMYATVCQLRALNPWCSEDRMVQYVKGLNRNAFRPPLPKWEVEKIVSKVYELKKVKLRLNRRRRFVYNPDYDLTARDKRAINIRLISEKKRAVNSAAIDDVIKSWDFKKRGKITIKSLSEAVNLSFNTVARRYKDLKEKIKQKNLDYKKNNY